MLSILSKAALQPFVLVTLICISVLGCQKPAQTQTDDSVNTEETSAAIAISEAASSSPTPSQAVSEAGNPATESPTAIEVVEQPITILALGDSLTEGLGVSQDDAYPAQLQEALQQAGYINAKVINSGLSGETSSGLVSRLDWALKTNPDITILTIGANDAMRGIDVDTVESNLRTAIERLQSEGSVVVLGGMQIYDNLGNDYVNAFSNIYPKLAKEYDIALIPFFLDGVGGVAELNQSDAIHPTAEGYTKIVNDNILPVLRPTLEGIVNQS